MTVPKASINYILQTFSSVAAIFVLYLFTQKLMYMLPLLKSITTADFIEIVSLFEEILLYKTVSFYFMFEH
jgi:hypothetical protein